MDSSSKSNWYIELKKFLITSCFFTLGIQPFCMAAVDNHGQIGGQYCVMFAVGGPNAGVLYPTFVQNTASPIGTVMATQTLFSIQGKDFFTISFPECIKRKLFIYFL
jgi:hypothetical protein